MKVCISISDDLFEKADAIARRRNLPRSTLYAKAIEEYVRASDEKELQKRINQVCAEVDTSLGPVLRKIQGHSLTKERD